MLNTGRMSADLCLELKDAISAGRFRAGTFLPGQRELAVIHGVSRTTVKRTMKELQEDGYVVAEARRGYRVLPRANDPDLGCPVAFVLSKESALEGHGYFGRALGDILKEELGAHGWEFMHLLDDRAHMPALLRGLSGTQAWGVVVDSAYPEVLKSAAELGLPTVTVDSWSDEARCDGVVQDNVSGAYSAAQYLLQRGHKSIAWCGSAFDSFHARTRLGGASSALNADGLGFSSVNRVSFEHEERVEEVLALLKKKNRPTGILALWMSIAAVVVEAARRLDLKLGRDLDVIGWCAEEVHDQWQETLAAAGGTVPAVVWSVRDMVRTAVQRLAERRNRPGMPVVRMTIPTRLRQVQ
jgi:DNA-binding LacI/PurR family transcriptional regulator/biotin operon repressor